jgi:hypothetical protein
MQSESYMTNTVINAIPSATWIFMGDFNKKPDVLSERFLNINDNGIQGKIVLTGLDQKRK